MKSRKFKIIILLAIMCVAGVFGVSLLSGKDAKAATGKYITVADLNSLDVSFEKSSYAVVKGDTITLSLDTNIPSESYYTECSLNNFCAKAISMPDAQDKVLLTGNFVGDAILTVRLNVTYCDANGAYLGTKKYAATARIKVIDVHEKAYEVGQSFKLEHKNYDNYKNMRYEISDKNVLKINGNEFVVVGTGICYVYLVDSTGKKTTIAVVEGTGKGEVLSEKEITLLKGSTPYGIIINNTDGKPVRWTSSDNNIASVDPMGTVTPVSAGDAVITATVSMAAGKSTKYNFHIHVIEPKIALASNNTSPSVFNVAAGYSIDLYVTGARGIVTWSSSDVNVAEVFSSVATSTQGAATVYGIKRGTAVIKAVVDGVTLSATVAVNSPSVNSTFVLIPIGMKQTIKIDGLDKASKVTYKSYNKKVATVSKKGVIKAKKKGYAPVLVTADGANYVVNVNVGSSKAVSAVLNAMDAEGAAYSQARRMEDGYYDCSSLVWRSYSPLNMYFGKKKYAPVAADEARYCVKKGKYIKKKYIKKLTKLHVGDLIFYSGSGNGRYKNIRHVAIYMGRESQYFGGKFYTKGKLIHANGRNVSQTYMYNESSVSVIGRPFK